MRHNLFDHDPGAIVHRKARDAGADGGKGGAPQLSLIRDLQTAAGRAAQALRVGPAAQAHARRMDDKTRRQLPATGDGGIADRDGADRPALGLDRRTTGTGDGTGNAAAQLQVVIGRVDDGVDILLRQVALQDLNGQAPGPPAHPLKRSNGTKPPLAWGEAPWLSTEARPSTPSRPRRPD